MISEKEYRDNRFVKEGIPLIPLNKEGEPVFKSWRIFYNKKQGYEDLKRISGNETVAYGPLLGVKNLRAIRFRKEYFYYKFVDEFPDLKDTYTVLTPDGIVSFYFSENGVKAVPVNHVGVEILQKGPVPAEGLQDRRGFHDLRVLNDSKIMVFEGLVKTMTGWVWSQVDKYPWVGWPCVNSFLRNPRFIIKAVNPLLNLLLRYDDGVGENDAVLFFKVFKGFDEDKCRAMFRETKEKIDGGGLTYPSCKALRRALSWRGSCDSCGRPDEVAGASEKFTLEKIQELFVERSKRIHHGQYFDPERGLVYASTIPGFDEIAVVTKDGFFKGVPAELEAKALEAKADRDTFIIEGHTAPLFDQTIEDMLAVAKMREVPHPNITLASVFDEVLIRVVNHYLELRDKREPVILALWIIGTYMRQIFVWYPYITFYGLRDVGKSTALAVLSHSCFNGGGVISGSGTEATLLRSAESSKGLQIIDHYEVIRKSKDKKQVYEQFLENAWHLNTVAERTNANTMEVERFRIASSVAVASRYIDTVLEEKGIVITMVDSANEDLKNRSSEIDTDPSFKEIRRRIMYVALEYADKVFQAYYDIPEVPGLYGRDRNKFKPLLALAKVLEDKGKVGVFDEVAEYAVEYRMSRKEEVKDLEEALLLCIVENSLDKTTYGELLDLLEDAGFDRVHWQTLRADLKKLNIGFRTYKGAAQRSATIYIDLRRARERAIQRGLIKPVNGSDEDSGDDEGVDENPHETRVNTPTDNEPPNIRKTGMGEIEKRIIKELQDPDDPRLGTGVGSLTRRVSTDLMVDVEDVRKTLMKLMRERVVEEPVMGYYKLVEYTEW